MVLQECKGSCLKYSMGPLRVQRSSKSPKDTLRVNRVLLGSKVGTGRRGSGKMSLADYLHDEQILEVCRKA